MIILADAAQLEQGGVYCIRNTVNDRVYVGSTKSFSQRCDRHNYLLEKGCHFNSYLQRAWRKYGNEIFVFSILDFVESPADLLEKEQYWIDELNSHKDKDGYNICLIAGKPPGVKGIRWTEERKELLRIKSIGKRHSPESIEKMRESSSREYIVIKPTGEVLLIKNLVAFSKANNLPRKHMCDLAREKRKATRDGWRCMYATEELKEKFTKGELVFEPYKGRFRTYFITDPDGNTYVVENLAEFSRLHEMERSGLLAVARGVRGLHKGWKCEYLD